MGKFLTQAGGPLFDPLRDRGNKPGGALYDPLRNATVNNKPGGALYDPVRNSLMGGSGASGGTDPAVMAMYADRMKLAPGSPGTLGNMQRDPQTGKMIPMPMPSGASGLGGMPYGTAGWSPTPNVPNVPMPAPMPAQGMDKYGTAMADTQRAPSDQGVNMVGSADPTAQAAMSILSSGGKYAGQPMQQAIRSMQGGMQRSPAPYIVRQPGYYQ